MWKNVVERVSPQMTVWRMRIACWIPKATNSHTDTGCVILIAFPQQQWLHERTSMLRYTYFVLFVVTFINFKIPDNGRSPGFWWSWTFNTCFNLPFPYCLSHNKKQTPRRAKRVALVNMAASAFNPPCCLLAFYTALNNLSFSIQTLLQGVQCFKLS